MKGLVSAVVVAAIGVSMPSLDGHAAGAAPKLKPATDIPVRKTNPVPMPKKKKPAFRMAVKEAVIGVPNDIFATYADGEPIGVIAQATDTILKEMGFATRYQNMPKKAMRKAVHSGQLDVGTSILKFSSRAKLAHYSEPILTEYSVLAVRRGESFEVKETADLRGKKLGGRRGFVYPLLTDDSSIFIERNRTDGENIRRLLLGEIDAAIIGAISDVFDLRAEGVMSELEILDHAVGAVHLSVVLADERFETADLETFNTKLADLKQSHRWKMILEQNAVADLVKVWPLVEKSKSSGWFW